MIHFLVALALCYVLIKIPFWVLGAIKGGGSSFLGGLVRGFIAYKTLGMVGGGGGRAGRARKTSSAPAPPAEPGDPYARARTDSRGQYAMPFEGLKRTKPKKPPHERYAQRRQRPNKSSGPRGKQGSLFLVDADAEGARTVQPHRRALPPDLGPGAARHEAQPGQQTMLPIPTRHTPDRTGRRTLADEPAPPSGAAATDHDQEALLFRNGRVRAAARPPRAGQSGALPVSTEPGQQQHLPLVGPFTSQARPSAATSESAQPEPTGPSRVPKQQPLLRRDGSVHPTARARRPRRARPPAPRLPDAYRGLRPDKHGQYPLPLATAPRPRPRPRPGRASRPESSWPHQPAHHPRQQLLALENLPTDPDDPPAAGSDR